MPKVTIIMPSLNVADYIRPCVKSVLGQTLKDIEILVVDAGSTDGTLDILKEYESKDNRLKVINSEKKSYGYQVNIGLEQALGEYIGIVETDDFIAENMYETLYLAAIDSNLEYVKGGFQQFIELQDEQIQYQPGGSCIYEKEMVGKIISPKDLPILAIQDYYLWAGIYSRSLLQNIRLSETTGAAFQDIGFIYQVLSRTTRAMYIDEELYYYRQTIGNSSFNRNGFSFLLNEYKQLEKVFLKQTLVWKQAYYERLFQQTLGRFQRMAVGGKYWYETEMDIMHICSRLKKAEKEGLLLINKFSTDEQMLYKLLFIRPQEIFDYYKNELYSEAVPLIKLCEKIRNKDIVIFGCGKCGKFMQALLSCYIPKQRMIFCDNNPKLWNKKIQSIWVMQPDEACSKFENAVYVLSNFNNTDIMKAQLIKEGIKEQNIILIKPVIDLRLFMMQELFEEKAENGRIS